MKINEKEINKKSELLNLIRDRLNPLEYVKDINDIDFICNSIVIKGINEDTYFEEEAEILLKAIIFYVLFTTGEEKTLKRCKEIAEIGIKEENGREKLSKLFSTEENAKILYKSIDIAPEKTYQTIIKVLNERISEI